MLRYSIIVPARDEEQHLTRMLESLLAQRLPFVSLHVVDDGSCDGTAEILKTYSKICAKLRVTTLPRTAKRREGGESAVQIAFGSVNWELIDVLARLDADISFGSDFFEILMEKFDQDPKLGIASGVIYEESNGKWTAKRGPAYHTRGATKLYRRECYQRIEPIGTCLGWDGQDEARANCYGWKTQSFNDAHVFHHRPVGAVAGRSRYYRNLGLSAYYIGYHPFYMLARALATIGRQPYMLGSLLMLTGMAEGYWRKLPREDRTEVISFVREQQINRLLGRESVWK